MDVRCKCGWQSCSRPGLQRRQSVDGCRKSMHIRQFKGGEVLAEWLRWEDGGWWGKRDRGKKWDNEGCLIKVVALAIFAEASRIRISIPCSKNQGGNEPLLSIRVYLSVFQSWPESISPTTPLLLGQATSSARR